MVRFFALFVASVAGLAAAMGLGFLTWPTVTRSKSSDDWSVKVVILEVCCAFFAVTYWTGRLVAVLFGARDLALEIRDRSRWHMGCLHLVLGATIIFDHAFRISREGSGFVHWALISFGVALEILALYIFLRHSGTQR